nr:hypothetical protein [Tanacetum cinerariifolium]
MRLPYYTPSHPKSKYFQIVSNFISKCCLKEAFTRVPNQYVEYLAEFWYTTKILGDSKIWVSTPVSLLLGDTTYLTQVKVIDGPDDLVFMRKDREKVVPYPRFISLLLEYMMPEYENEELTLNPLGMDKRTQNYSLDHIFARTNQSVLVDKTKFARDGLNTAHDEPIIISNESKEKEIETYEDTQATPRDGPEDTSVPHPPSSKLAEAKFAFLKDHPLYPNVNQLSELLVCYYCGKKSLKATDKSVPSAGHTNTSPTEGEKNTKKSKGKEVISFKDVKEYETESGEQIHLTTEKMEEQKRIEEYLKAELAKQEVENVKDEPVNLMGIDLFGRGDLIIPLHSGLIISLHSDKMADENVLAPTPTPTRFDDQMLPFAAWNTLTYEAKTGAYSFQLHGTHFVLDANLLRDALEITPINQAHQFVSPSSDDAIMDFVNQMGYTQVIHFGSRKAVNNLYQPWRAILSMINHCLTGKRSRHDRPRYLVLQMLWGRIHNIHQRSISPFHLAQEDLRLGNLKFVPKGKIDEVFEMPIPDELISNNIRNAPYYNAYMEMDVKHDQKVTADKEGNKKTASTKQPKSNPAMEKSSKPAPVPKPKINKVKSSKAYTGKPPKPSPAIKTTKGKVRKVRKVKCPFQLVDEPDEEPAYSKPELELEHQGKGDEDDMERAI